ELVRMAVTRTDGTDSTGRSLPEEWSTTAASRRGLRLLRLRRQAGSSGRVRAQETVCGDRGEVRDQRGTVAHVSCAGNAAWLVRPRWGPRPSSGRDGGGYGGLGGGQRRGDVFRGEPALSSPRR